MILLPLLTVLFFAALPVAAANLLAPLFNKPESDAAPHSGMHAIASSH